MNGIPVLNPTMTSSSTGASGSTQSSPQLSDIMAAFNIPDTGSALTAHSTPLRAPVPGVMPSYSTAPQASVTQLPTPPPPPLPHSAPVMMAKGGAPSQPPSLPLIRVNYPPGVVPVGRPVTPGAGVPSGDQQVQQPLRGGGADAPGVMTTTLAGAGAAPALTYVINAPKQFRHQHEAAIELDAQQNAEPMLVYSKEDWPSPDHENISQDSDSGQPGMGTVPMLPSTSGPVLSSLPSGVPTQAAMTSGSSCTPPQLPAQNGAEFSVRRNPKRNATRNRQDMNRPYGTDPAGLGGAWGSVQKQVFTVDSFKPFRSVMTAEHDLRLARGMTNEDMIALMGELHQLLKAKQCEAKRLRRARLSDFQLEEERRKNRDRKRMARQNPLVEYRHIMTDEQRRLLMQPDLDPERKNRVLFELQAVRKWINREQKRMRRAQMSDEQRETERRKSREYKRRARSDPILAFKSVMTSQHYDLLEQDLDADQQEALVQELIELKKTQQREEMRARRANIAMAQRGVQHAGSTGHWAQQQAPDDQLTSYSGEGGLVPGGSNQDQNADQLRAVQQGDMSLSEPQSLDSSIDLLMRDPSLSRTDLEKLKNRERQRRRRAMQTEEEREDERRKNRERSRMRRMKLSKIADVVAIGTLTPVSTSHSNHHSRNRLLNSPYHPTNPSVGIKTEVNAYQDFYTPPSQVPIPVPVPVPNNVPLPIPHNVPPPVPIPVPMPSPTPPLQTPAPRRRSARGRPARAAPWFTEQMLEEIRQKNRESTRRVRARMTVHQRERERQRNRERQRLKRLMQTPEERAAYVEKQRYERRRQRMDPAYRERERQKQRERKKKLRESPWYRAHETKMYQLRKARKTSYSEDFYYMNTEGQEFDSSNYDSSQDPGEASKVGAVDMHPVQGLKTEVMGVGPQAQAQVQVQVQDDGKGRGGEEVGIMPHAGSLVLEHVAAGSIGLVGGNNPQHLAENQGGLSKQTAIDVDNQEEIMKIANSIFGMHRIVPLNQNE